MRAQRSIFDFSVVQKLKVACARAESAEQTNRALRLLNKHIFQTEHKENVFANTTLSLLKQDRPMPVLLFHACGWQYGGAERLITNIVNELVKKKYRIVIVAFDPVVNTAYRLDSSIAFIRVCGMSDRIKRLLLLIDLLRPDVFIGHNNSMPEVASLYAILRQKKIPAIAYNLEYFFFPHNDRLMASTVIARSRALDEASAACFLTNFSANAHALIHGNAAVMPGLCGFDFPEGSPPRNAGKTVLAIGRFADPIKRLDRVLIAFHHLLARHDDAKLRVVGPYDLDLVIPPQGNESIRELLERLDFPRGSVSFTGEQTRTEPYYSQANLMILTSNSEGFPMVLMEAGCNSLPAIIVNIPGLEDVITDGENGYIVGQDDMVKMAERIADLFDHPELLRTMSVRARSMAERFTRDKIGSRWDDLLQLILSRKTQEEINRELAERFMHGVADKKAFTMRVVQEYENTALLLLDPVQSNSGAFDSIQIASMAAQRLISHLRAYGLLATAYKASRIIFTNLLQGLTRIARKLNRGRL